MVASTLQSSFGCTLVLASFNGEFVQDERRNTNTYSSRLSDFVTDFHNRYEY